jgi:hypothetical protein
MILRAAGRHRRVAGAGLPWGTAVGGTAVEVGEVTA